MPLAMDAPARLFLMPLDATRIVTYGPPNAMLIGCSIPGGRKTLTLGFDKPRHTLNGTARPDVKVDVDVGPVHLVMEGSNGATFVFHDDVRMVAVRYGNAKEDGNLCWGASGNKPTSLREAAERLWSTTFRAHLLPIWRDYHRCVEHTCQRRQEGEVCPRVHVCSLEPRMPCTAHSHRCAGLGHGKKCRIWHRMHSIPKSRCACCKRRGGCGCVTPCTCCNNTCSCCPCKNENCACPRASCDCCRGLCQCLNRTCPHNLDEMFIEWVRGYQPDYLAPVMPFHDPTPWPVVPAMACVLDTVVTGNWQWMPVTRREDGRWITPEGSTIKVERQRF